MTENSGTTYWGLLNATIDGGIAAARADYVRPDQADKLRGSVAGFEACREKDRYELVALWSDAGAKANQCNGNATIYGEGYWYWRCYQLEVEWVLNVLSAALRCSMLSHLPTARGVMRAAEIVGVADD